MSRPSLSKEELFEYMRRHRYAVISSVSPSGTPEAAVVGFTVSPALEIVFDTVNTSRKYSNLTANPAAAAVIWAGETTVQFEGVAEEARGAERERIREVYFEAWPDGRDRLSWPGITHFVIRPKWIRYTDFTQSPPLVEEFRF